MKLFIYSTTKSFEKGGKKLSFTSYYTKLDIIVKGEEEKRFQRKSLTVKFIEDLAMPKGLSRKDIKRGVIEVPDDKISYPYLYEITTTPEGKKLYPTIWIREITSYEYIPYEFKDKPKFVMEQEQEEDFKDLDETPFDENPYECVEDINED